MLLTSTERSAAGALSRHAARRRRRSRSSLEAAAREGRRRGPARARPGERADRDRRVLRLPVPVLPARVSDRQARCWQTYGDRDPLRLPPLPAAEPSRTRGRPPKRRRAPPNRASSGRITTGCSRTPSKLTDADLKQHAADLGLDTATFNTCVDSRKYQEGCRRGHRRRPTRSA